MIFKFNGGQGAVLCGKCNKVLYEGSRIPKYITDAVMNGTIDELPDLFCEDGCKFCDDEQFRKKPI